MSQIIEIREDDTEPLIIKIGARGVTDLSSLTVAALFMRRVGDQTNHVNGVSCPIYSSADLEVSFDPVGSKMGGGNAFDGIGTYKGYIRATWSDGDITRHPQDEDLVVKVRGHHE